MVNELEEYLRILECILTGEMSLIANPIHHQLLWVSDAIGHAAILAYDVDQVEGSLKGTGETFAHHFKDLYLKAVEMKG